MTLADLMVTIRERTLQKGRDAIVLAWRSAYYRRIKQMPALQEALDDYTADHAEAWRGSADDVDKTGHLSAPRARRVWGTLKTGLMAWNAKLAEQGA